jgi:phospholipid-transporting ATPase
MSDARNYGSVVNETLRQVAFGTQTAVPEVQVDDLVCDNKVTTSKYTAANFLFKSLALQFRRFANIYFVVQTIIMMVGWYTNLFGAPFSPWSMLGMLVFVLGIVMVFEARDDLFRHAQDKALNERKQAIFRVEDGRVQAKTVAWQDIRVGDILLVKNKESFAADLVLLASSEDSGICYVETSNIDGETNLKLHLSNEAISFPIKKGCDNKADNVLAFLSMCQFECSVEKPNQVVTNFNGSAKFSCPGRDNSKPIPLSFSNFLLRGAQLRNTQWVLGLVVYTGAQTKVMMNSRETASKMSSIEQMVNHTLYTIVFAQCALVTITDVAKLVWDAEYLTDTSGYWYLFPPGGELQSYIFPDWLANWLTYFILFNNFVPINLYAVMEFCNLLQGYFINMDAKMYDPNTDTAARARSSNLCQELGQVEYIFSDKTGTLTQNVMKLMRCSVGDRIYGALSNGSFTNAAKEMSTALKTPGETANTIDMLFTVLAVAHTVVIEAQGDGDFIYQAESPDEAALVQGAAEVGYRFVGRRGNVCNLMVNGVSRSYEILAVNVFNSTRKRMSVVVRDDAKTYHLFVKGADNVMFDRASAPASERIDSHLNEFAQEGLRTLVMGYRALDEKEFFAWQVG